LKLFDITIGSYLQTIEAMIGFLETSRIHFESHDIDLDEVNDKRLYGDMQPFKFQILAVVVHSIGIIEALESGVFDPEPPKHEPTYEGLQDLLEETCQRLERYRRETVEEFENDEIQVGGNKMNVKVYLLSQGIPNFYFHATTAYDILRMLGAPIGKMDFLGSRRLGVQ
jgi:hypothetical protein